LAAIIAPTIQMTQQDSIRIRILFQTGENEFRKFYWVELKNKDLYWGPSAKQAIDSAYIIIDRLDEGQITIPETIETAEKLYSKYSYHESGNVHLKKTFDDRTNEYGNHSVWQLKDNIKEPRRFFAIISKPIIQYELYKKKITADKTKAFILKVEPETLNSRIYIELFLSPKGTFKIQPSILEGKLSTFGEIKLSNDLNLLIGLGNLKGIDEWHRDKEITFVPNTLD